MTFASGATTDRSTRRPSFPPKLGENLSCGRGRDPVCVEQGLEMCMTDRGPEFRDPEEREWLFAKASGGSESAAIGLCGTERRSTNAAMAGDGEGLMCRAAASSGPSEPSGRQDSMIDCNGCVRCAVRVTTSNAWRVGCRRTRPLSFSDPSEPDGLPTNSIPAGSRPFERIDDLALRAAASVKKERPFAQGGEAQRLLGDLMPGVQRTTRSGPRRFF